MHKLQRHVLLLLGVALPAGLLASTGCTKTPLSLKPVAPLGDSLQVLQVTVSDWNSSQGFLQRYERSTPQASFMPVGETVPVWVGRNGVAWPSEKGAPAVPSPNIPIKREGDGRSPIGILPLGDLWGYGAHSPIQVHWPYHASDPLDRCVDDTSSPFYAKLQRAPITGKAPWNSAESLRMPTDHYKYLLVLDYNMRQPQPGAGSCIFLHVAPPPGKPTAGCTALAEEDLLTVLRWLDPKKHPVLLQFPTTAKKWIQQTWQWPLPLG